MLQTPEWLLFKNEDSKLFDSLSELVDFVITNDKSRFKISQKIAFKSSLSQAINGNRKLSPNVELSIRDSLENSGYNKSKVKFINNNLKSIFDNYYSFIKGIKDDDIVLREDDFLTMQEDISRAKTVDIITTKPITRNPDTASKLLMETFLNKVGVLETEKGSIKKGAYNFYFPYRKGNSALLFWEDLLNFSIEKGIEEGLVIEKILKSNNIDDDDSNDVRVFYVPDYLVHLTFCIINHNEVDSHGYVTSFEKLKSGNNEIRVLRFGGDNLDEFIEITLDVILNLKRDSSLNKKSTSSKYEVRFKDVLEAIKKRN